MKKLSLQWKITLLVGMITVLACLGVTLNGVFSAPAYYSSLVDQGIAEPDIPAEGADPALNKLPIDPSLLAQDFPAYTSATRLYSIQSIVVMLGIVLLSLTLTYWVTGRILRPLNTLNSSVKHIGGQDLHIRIPLPKSEDEVRELTQSFNAMLGRLEEAFQVQKSFAANAAHELKTPLAVMKTSLQVLELDEEPAPDDYREFADNVRQSLERLSGTVENLLALANDSVDQPEPVPLRELLDQAAQALASKAAERSVLLSVEGEGRLVRGNRVLLYRVFFNLMENAVKYNREGGSVEVTLKERDENALVEIADTGAGIPAESLHHIFEPFYRADKSRSQTIPGSGLGLSIVKSVLDRCGGSIQIDSEEGKGTTVWVILPEIQP